MSVVEVEPGLGRSCPDPVTAHFDTVLTQFESLVGDCTPISEAARIDRIGRLERLRASVAAAQAAELVRLGQARVAAALAKNGSYREVDPAVADLAPDPVDWAASGCKSTKALADAGVSFDPARIGAGLIDEIGLACRSSPWQAARRLRVARALWFDLPDTFAALTTGGLSEQVAGIVVRETRHLDHRQRGEVDRQLADAGITDLGWRAAEALAKRFAYQQDRQGYVDRSQLAREDRAGHVATGPGLDVVPDRVAPLGTRSVLYRRLGQGR